VGIGIATAVAMLMAPFFEAVNQVMVYLLAVALIATRFGRGPSVLASVLAVVSFDFFRAAAPGRSRCRTPNTW
jgi:two-component system sensor histidine kinase KdpD